MQRRGYLMKDERAAGGKLQEFATETCCHCNRIVILNPLRQRERGYCRKCDAYICDNGGCRVNCIPMQRVIDMAALAPQEPHLLYGPSGEPLVSQRILDKTQVY